ncbi:MAG: ParB/RepB/Spo0J family partition protein, partial [Pseudomonadota bacterium]
MKRKALGRGLSALIPESSGPTEQTGHDFFSCPIEALQPSEVQPRTFFDNDFLEELAASIKEQGIIQPLVVRPLNQGKYAIVVGERRWRAAQKAGLHEVPVVIREVSDQQALEMALVENLQRQDLNPIERAVAFKSMIEEHNHTQDQLAKKLGQDRSTVANTLRLLKLPQAAQDALVSNKISSGHARALLGIDDQTL